MADEKTNASGKDIAVVSQDNSGQGRGVPDGNSPVERVTLDEMIDKARFIDENAEEPPEVERQICAMAERIISISKQGKPIRIVTDYDADGMCFAYIMDKTLHKLNPNIDLKVICNDRRNPYGVPKSLVPEPNAQYIVGDMGSNELSYIWKTFGEGTLVIDHHLIEDSKDKELFNRESNLLNPHSISCADGKTAEYCATGLAYRVCNTIIYDIEQELQSANYLLSKINKEMEKCNGRLSEVEKVLKNDGIVFGSDETQSANSLDVYVYGEEMFGIELYLGNNSEQTRIVRAYLSSMELGYQGIWLPIDAETGLIENPFDKMFHNSIDIVAGIGTIADVVDLADIHSYNRSIVKTALIKINQADESNLDFQIGYLLAQSGIGEADVTAKKIGYNVVPFMNAASRMSDVIGKNGAQMMYDYLVSQDQTQSVIAFSELSEINSIRKNMKSEIMDKRYYDFVEAQRFGSSKDDAIAIYMLDMDKPHSMCGLIAGALSEAIDKPAIVLAMKYDEETKTTGISGSARNSPRMESLKAFMDYALSQADEQLEVRYGGHENALGFSSINNFELFKKAIMEHQHELKERDTAPLRLEISHDELSSQSTLDKLMKLEPLGEGFKLPPVEISGKELRRTQNFIKQNPRWKHITVKDCVSVTDWCYSPEAYPPDSAGRIRLLAELNVNDYYGLKVEASAVFNRSFLAERQKELEQTAPKKQIDKSKA